MPVDNRRRAEIADVAGGRVAVLRISSIARAVGAGAVVLGTAWPAAAQRFDATFFVGRAFPTYDQRLTLRPPTPAIPGVDVSVVGSPVIEADGGPVFGGALAFEFGILGIEGRLDATDIGLEFTGARYDLQATEPPAGGLAAQITVSDARFDADRIPLLSANARIRTPGSVALVVSGGLSYLPDFSVNGSIPLRLDAPANVVSQSVDARLTLRAAPGQSGHRWGVNGGAGLRIGGRVAVTGEIRVFYFREYELRFLVQNGPDVLDELVSRLAPVRFNPVFVNAQAGVTFRF